MPEDDGYIPLEDVGKERIKLGNPAASKFKESAGRFLAGAKEKFVSGVEASIDYVEKKGKEAGERAAQRKAERPQRQMEEIESMKRKNLILAERVKSQRYQSQLSRSSPMGGMGMGSLGASAFGGFGGSPRQSPRGMTMNRPQRDAFNPNSALHSAVFGFNMAHGSEGVVRRNRRNSRKAAKRKGFIFVNGKRYKRA
jgi:hypothetical protein